MEVPSGRIKCVGRLRSPSVLLVCAPRRNLCPSTNSTESPAVSLWSLRFILLGPHSGKTVVLNWGKPRAPTQGTFAVLSYPDRHSWREELPLASRS